MCHHTSCELVLGGGRRSRSATTDPIDHSGLALWEDVRVGVHQHLGAVAEQIGDRSKLADVALPYGDLTADKIGIGLAVATGAAIAGHAVLKAARGKSSDDSRK